MRRHPNIQDKSNTKSVVQYIVEYCENFVSEIRIDGLSFGLHISWRVRLLVVLIASCYATVPFATQLFVIFIKSILRRAGVRNLTRFFDYVGSI